MNIYKNKTILKKISFSFRNLSLSLLIGSMVFSFSNSLASTGFYEQFEFPEYEFDQDLEVFKRIELSSFPHMQIPIYKSSGTQGPAILFIHGNSSSSRAFHRQVFSEFGRRRKLFFMDLPGHGLASKVSVETPMPLLQDGSHPAGFSEYQEGVAEAIAQVANDLDVNAKVIVGWSLGGHAAIKTYGLGLLPEIKGIYIFGTAPAVRESPLSEGPFRAYNSINRLIGMPTLPGIGLSFKLSPFYDGFFRIDAKFKDRMPFNSPPEYRFYPDRGAAYMRAFLNPEFGFFQKTPRFIVEDGYERSDDRFRTSLAVLALELDPRDSSLPNELEILNTIGDDGIVLGVGVGERDAFINQDYLIELKEKDFFPTLWNNQIQIFSESGHAPQLENPNEFNQIIDSFILNLF